MSSNRLVEASLRTDQGRVREHNEDFVTSREPTSAEDENRNGWLYIVADGVGGADAGEVASRYASERTVFHYLENTQEDHPGKRLWQAMQSANTDLRRFVADRKDHSRMATTMVAMVIQDKMAYLANVGDSRGYYWHKGTLRQVTKDQSLVAKLLEEGAITEAEAAIHPRKNVILYSLGSEREPQIDLFEQPLESGDILLLCSDGLNRHVTDNELAAVLKRFPPDTATEGLLKLANKRGGEDNISAAVMHYDATKRQPRVVPEAKGKKGRFRSLLWLYTFVLSFVQSALIILAWLWLRV